jgi:ATP-dependent Clp protease protease subunit
MPIGVPKVPYRMPGDDSAQWVDLYNRLYRERILFLCQNLDDELAKSIGIMLYLNSENKSKIFVFILIHPVVLLLVVLVFMML